MVQMQPFKQTYLLLSAQTYNMTDEDTGALIEGVSLWYLPSDNLDAVEDEAYAARGGISRGIKVAKVSLPLDKRTKIVSVPGLYEFTLEMTSVAQRLQVRAKDIDFIGTAKLVHEKPKQHQGG